MRTGRNDDAPVQEEEGWASISANEVSDDEDPDPQLIVPGDESANDSSINLSSSSIDLSHVDILAIADSLIPPEDIVIDDDNEEEEEEDQQGHPDDLVDEVDHDLSHAFAARVKSLMENKKVIILLFVSAVILVGAIAGGQAWKRHSERIAFLEEEVQRLQEIERKARELEKKSCGWQEGETGRELADNCYFHAGLGECTKNMVADFNEKATNVYKAFENVVKSWEEEDENDAEDHPNLLASIGVDTFSEVMDAVSHTIEAAGDALNSFWREVSAATEESLQFVAKEFSVDRVEEFTREALDDATAYTRPEK